jgi:hypothetical protein
MSAPTGPPPPPTDEQESGFAFRPYKVASPKPFDRDKSKYQSFRCSLDQCFRSEPEKFPEAPPEARILFTLLYMQKGLAEQWANHFYDAATAARTIPAWSAFEKQLDASFTDANTVNIARKKLKNLVQGRTPAIEYFLNFEYLLLVAGYDRDTHLDDLVELLEDNVNPGIIDTIYCSETLPATYDAWKARIINIDNLYHRRQERKKVVDAFWSKPKAVDPAAQANRLLPRPTPATNTCTMPDAMDVDHKHMPSTRRKCYNCGQVPADGHLACNCPLPSTWHSIRAVETQPTESDLAKEMREMRKELKKLREENTELRKRREDF